MKQKSLNTAEIVSKSLREIQFARRYKQGKVKNWQKNERMYYGQKAEASESRANVELGRMQEYVHSILAQIDTPLRFKFAKRKEAQLKRVGYLNALRDIDAQRDTWDFKDLMGKKQAIIYGRAAYCYYADSLDRVYMPHLENIDVYDLLVDPSAGGMDVEAMEYWGRFGVTKTRAELREGARKGGIYISQAVNAIIEGSGNATQPSAEQNNKSARTNSQSTIGSRQLETREKFVFWQWFTTYEGVRYVLLLEEGSGQAISVTPLSELFGSGRWPLWTWAAFPDLTEFWTPSYCDYVRDIFQTQNVNINQMLDNAEAINKPQRMVNVNAIENLAELKYRRDGLIKVKGDFKFDDAYQTVRPNEITTPMLVFDKLDAIQEKATGVTAGVKAAEDVNGKVGIYEGNQAQAAGRFALLNKSYAFGYARFAVLYQDGVRDHLNAKVAVDLMGPAGLETHEIGRRDIFRKNDDFSVMVEASNSEQLASQKDKDSKIAFLQAQVSLQRSTPNGEKFINEKKAFELQGRIAGFSEDELKELSDVSDFATSEIMAEAARDIERVLDGEKGMQPNKAANTAYKQKFIDYMLDHEENMSERQKRDMVAYVRSLDAIIAKNMARALLNEQTKALSSQKPQATQQPMQGQDITQNGPQQPENGAAQGMQITN